MKHGIATLVLLLAPHLSVGQESQRFDELARQAELAIGERPAEAAALYRRALALRPGWAEGWLYMGTALLELGRFVESRDALRKGAELEPGKGTPWACLGLAEYELGDYQQALRHFLKGESTGLADRPAFVAAVHYHAALIDLRTSDFAGALEQLRPVVRAGNNSPEIVQALGLTALFINSTPADLPVARQPLIQLAGRAAWAFLAERADQAPSLFAKLVAEYPSEPGVHYMFGAFLLDRDPTEAEAEFRNELRIVPQHVLSRVQLALLLAGRGDAAGAQELAKDAVRLDASNPLCQATLGRVLLSAGQTGEAIVALERAEQLAPEAARTHYYLQQAYKRAGRTADAEKQKAEFDRLRARQEPVTVGHSR